MFKILIVDDEKKHRSGLIRLLYTIYPEDMLLEADSAEQALEILKLLECDILITDIRMPGMDGMELVQKIRHENEGIAVIILSGYGEFHYAKDAIKYGVSDYLLKPVDIGEVKRCLDKIRGEITENREKIENQKSMKNHLQETEGIYMEYLMQQFMQHDGFDKDEKIRGIFPLEQPGYLFLCEWKAEEKQGFDVQEFRLAVKNYIQSFSSYSFRTEQKNLYAVLVLSAEKGSRNWFENMRGDLQKEFPGFQFSFYVSRIHENMYWEGAEAYREVMLLWKYRFYELGEYYDYDKQKERLEGEIRNFPDAVNNMIEHIKQNNSIAAFGLVKQYLYEACKDKLPDPSKLCRSVMLLLFQIVQALDPMMSDSMKKKTDEELMKIYQSETMGHLQRFVYSFLVELGKNVNFQKEIKGIDVLENCRGYLEKHYMEEITLESVAEKYYFNSSYFSTIFKNYFDKSFSNYLIELRMKNAKRLLAVSEYKIKEIALKVGYRDANYFIRAFKKFYGYTPEEYRKLRAQE